MNRYALFSFAAVLTVLSSPPAAAEDAPAEVVAVLDETCERVSPTKGFAARVFSRGGNTFFTYCDKTGRGSVEVVPYPSRWGRCHGSYPYSFKSRCYPSEFGERVRRSGCTRSDRQEGVPKIRSLRLIRLYPGMRWVRMDDGGWVGPEDLEEVTTHCGRGSGLSGA